MYGYGLILLNCRNIALLKEKAVSHGIAFSFITYHLVWNTKEGSNNNIDWTEILPPFGGPIAAAICVQAY